MPTGPFSTPSGYRGWSLPANTPQAASAVSSVLRRSGEAGTTQAVYGADTHFLVPGASSTNAWARRQLTPPKLDARSATRRSDSDGPRPYSNDRLQKSPTSNEGGKDQKHDSLIATESLIDNRFALYPLSRDEAETASALINGKKSKKIH
jgi:hypothetical protein